VPLAEARLSSFLAADRDNTADDGGGLEAFLSGEITDASAKYNLNNLSPDNTGKPNTVQIEAFRKLCEYASVAGSSCDRIVDGIQAAVLGSADATIMPRRVEQLAWLGADPADVKRLEPYVTLLGGAGTKVNLNTASKEVIAAVTGASLSSAGRLVQSRQQDPLTSMDNAGNLLDLPQEGSARAQLPNMADIKSSYFEVQGQVRLGDRVLRERSLVYRADTREVTVIRRERVNLLSPGA
jgi:general secretion pathway protein K